VEAHFQASSHVRDPLAGDLFTIVPADALAMGISRPTAPSADAAAMGEAQTSEAPESRPPWLFAFNPGEDVQKLKVRLVVIIGSSDDFGTAFAGRLLSAGVRHVVCLLGGMSSLREDARSYLTSGVE